MLEFHALLNNPIRSICYLSLAPPDPPRDVTVGQRSGTWLQVTWSRVSASSPSATISYNVTATKQEGVVTSFTIADTTSALLSSLLPNTHYDVTVTPTAKAGSIRVRGFASRLDSVVTDATSKRQGVNE